MLYNVVALQYDCCRIKFLHTMEDFSERNIRRSTENDWNITSSLMAKRTNNPIRKIIEGMKLTPNPEKEMIALSIGKKVICEC